MSDLSDSKKLSDVYIVLVYQTKFEDTLDKLCKPYNGSKSTQVIKHNKSITAITDNWKRYMLISETHTTCHCNQEVPM